MKPAEGLSGRGTVFLFSVERELGSEASYGA
jgi:hypothetical protein